MYSRRFEKQCPHVYSSPAVMLPPASHHDVCVDSLLNLRLAVRSILVLEWLITVAWSRTVGVNEPVDTNVSANLQ